MSFCLYFMARHSKIHGIIFSPSNFHWNEHVRRFGKDLDTEEKHETSINY